MEPTVRKSYLCSCPFASLISKSSRLAFPVVDDIIDVVGKEEITGKPTGTDIKNNKLNYASILDLNELKQLSKTYTKKALSEIKEFEKNEFLIFLLESMLNRVN